MHDESVIIRPPSEAGSLLLPVTIGCSHNRCAFCGTYKDFRFDIRDLGEIKADIDEVARSYSFSVRRVFLENGDALISPQPLLLSVLAHLKQRFPRLERVATYATPKSALRKSIDDLKELRGAGLTLAYMGVESGDDEVLSYIDKGATSQQMIEAGRKLKEAGITTSVTVILGLGGTEGSERHAVRTGEALGEIDPDFAGALTLMLVPGTPLHREHAAGRFPAVTPFRALTELKLIIEHASFSKCFFTANHASNFLPLKARLPEQKTALLKLLGDVISRKDDSRFRPGFFRAL